MKSFLLKTLFRLISKLSNRWAQRLGGWVGTLMYFLTNREKRVATINIALCFPELSPREQRGLLKQTLQENAKTLFELPRIFQQGGNFALDLVKEVEGLSHYQQAIAQNKGVIIIAPHLGNWELVVHYLNQFAPMTAMYDPPNQPFLDDIMRQGRESSGATLVPANGRGVRAQLKHLKAGGVVGILPDQVPGHDNAGVYAPFMGHTAFTMTLVNNLAKRSGAVVLMSFAERLENARGYRVHIIPASSHIADADSALAAKALNSSIEKCVRLAPAQYQWTYKRFKHQPQGVASPY